MILEKWVRMLRRSIAVVLLSFGASHAASALEQRCGGPLDWLLCVNPSLSYSETSTQPPSPSLEARSQTKSDNSAAEGPPSPGRSHAAASPPPPRAPLSLDYRVINHASKTGTDPRTRSQTTKSPDGREKTMSEDEREQLYRAFLVWQRKQVINNMRAQ
jgi:hypothetical protein